MERFHLYRPPGAGGAFMAAADDGPWVRLADAQAAIDRLNRENADLRAKLAEAEKARDEQAEAVRKLAEYGGSAHGVGGPFKCWDSRRMIDAFDAVVADPIAWAALLQAAKKDPLAAAVKEAGGARDHRSDDDG